MAVFLTNSCKFDDCGLVFPTLTDLVQHIEEIHIASDPRILEKMESQQPGNVACSYILRFFGDTAHPASFHRRKSSAVAGIHCAASISSATTMIMSSLPYVPTPNGSDNGEGDAESDAESADSWAAQQEFAAQLIVSMMSSKDSEMEKPFCCPIPGCKKRYKNINGVKYHARHGHRKHPKELGTHKCFCGKTYRSEHSLLAHSRACHSTVAALAAASSPSTSANSSVDHGQSVSLTIGNGCLLQNHLVGGGGGVGGVSSGAGAVVASKLLLLPSGATAASLSRSNVSTAPARQAVLTVVDRTA